MDWLLGYLPSDIPKRDVDGREAVYEGTASPEDMEFLLQVQGQFAKLRCVPTDTFRGQDGIDDGLYSRNGRKAKCFPPAYNSCIGCDRYD